MKGIRIVLGALCASFLLIGFATQAASVWQVSNGKHTVYIGGTIHLLSASDYPLPAQYNKAYDQSDVIVFETDIVGMSQPAAQRKFLEAALLSEGQTIADYLSEDTLNELKAYLSAKNIPIANLQTFKPSMLYVTLTIIELQSQGINSQGVDQFYSTRALGDGKQQKWLESIDQQIAFMAAIGEENPDALIDYTLKEMDALPDTMDKIMAAWRNGDMATLNTVGIVPMREYSENLYNVILADRNNSWIPQIEQMLNTEETELVLVGALHLSGPHSVLTQLEKKGFSVTKL